jgi:hypothetical protein
VCRQRACTEKPFRSKHKWKHSQSLTRQKVARTMALLNLGLICCRTSSPTSLNSCTPRYASWGFCLSPICHAPCISSCSLVISPLTAGGTGARTFSSFAGRRYDRQYGHSCHWSHSSLIRDLPVCPLFSGSVAPSRFLPPPLSRNLDCRPSFSSARPSGPMLTCSRTDWSPVCRSNIQVNL